MFSQPCPAFTRWTTFLGQLLSAATGLRQLDVQLCTGDGFAEEQDKVEALLVGMATVALPRLHSLSIDFMLSATLEGKGTQPGRIDVSPLAALASSPTELKISYAPDDGLDRSRCVLVGVGQLPQVQGYCRLQKLAVKGLQISAAGRGAAGGRRGHAAARQAAKLVGSLSGTHRCIARWSSFKTCCAFQPVLFKFQSNLP